MKRRLHRVSPDILLASRKNWWQLLLALIDGNKLCASILRSSWWTGNKSQMMGMLGGQRTGSPMSRKKSDCRTRQWSTTNGTSLPRGSGTTRRQCRGSVLVVRFLCIDGCGKRGIVLQLNEGTVLHSDGRLSPPDRQSLPCGRIGLEGTPPIPGSLAGSRVRSSFHVDQPPAG